MESITLATLAATVLALVALGLYGVFIAEDLEGTTRSDDEELPDRLRAYNSSEIKKFEKHLEDSTRKFHAENPWLAPNQPDKESVMEVDDKVKMMAPADKEVTTNVCEWYTEEFDSEEDTDVGFETSCNQGFQFNNGSPSTNDFKFCPFCGRAIMEV